MRCREWCLAALSGLLLTLSYPPLGWGPVAWVALFPLLLALDGKTRLQRCLLGFVTGMWASWSVVGHWLFFAFHRVPLDLPAAAVLTQLTISVSGIGGFVLFAWLCGAWKSASLSVLWLSAGWVAIEYLRANVVGGSPWCLLGHSQYSLPLVIQVAALAGVYGVSFIVCMANLALASWWLAAAQRRLHLAIASALIVLSFAYGLARLRQAETDADPMVIQAVYPAWKPELGEAPEQRLADLMRTSAEVPPDPSALLIWPENALRFDLGDGELSDAFTSFVQTRRQFVIAGLHRYERRQGTTQYFNSAVLMAAEGSVIGVADKRMLVPVAESRWRLLPSVQQPFSVGKPWVPLTAGKKKIGVLMCFESIFPEPARSLVRQGATLLVNPTNDEILGDGAIQLAAMAVFRSVENGVPLVHAATVGVTQIVDRHGRIVASESSHPRVVTAAVSRGQAGTWYTIIGDAFAWACCAVLLLIAARSTVRLLLERTQSL
ncbi:MAG: apolipoprotein N-acyltransferase [Deltaproteobacteria bacterium]|nr:apolipoprotein N-acyltransferase [Deltaproteobacteria bacterium]